MMQTLCRSLENFLVVTILPVLIQPQVSTWAHFLRTTLTKSRRRSTTPRLLRLHGEKAHLLIENASSAASRNGSWRTRKCVRGLRAERRERRVRYASHWLGPTAYRGFIVIDAALGEILTTCSKMDWLLRHGEKYLRPETRSSPLILGYKKSMVHYEPLGVVAAIVSWNYRMA